MKHTVCTKWKRELYDLGDMFIKTSRRITVFGAKKLLDNDICLIMVKSTVLLWLLQ